MHSTQPRYQAQLGDDGDVVPPRPLKVKPISQEGLGESTSPKKSALKSRTCEFSDNGAAEQALVPQRPSAPAPRSALKRGCSSNVYGTNSLGVAKEPRSALKQRPSGTSTPSVPMPKSALKAPRDFTLAAEQPVQPKVAIPWGTTPRKKKKKDGKEDSSSSEEGSDPDVSTKIGPSNDKADLARLLASKELELLAQPLCMADSFPEHWTVKGLCRRAFYRAYQKDAWNTVQKDMKEVASSDHPRGSISKTIAIISNKESNPQAKSGKGARGSIFAVTLDVEVQEDLIARIDEDTTPRQFYTQGGAEATEGTGGVANTPAEKSNEIADTGGTPSSHQQVAPAVHPLKELITAAKGKVDIEQFERVLESSLDRHMWIDSPLSEGLPTPLFFAVGSCLPAVVRSLLQFGADCRRTYDGEKMYLGWIRPGANAMDAVTNRKARFVGTMFGNKLEEVLALLMAADAMRDERGQAMQDEILDKAALDQKEHEVRSKSNNATDKECELPDDLTPPQCMQGGATKIRFARGVIPHTQGHPSEKYDVINELGEGVMSVTKEALCRKNSERYAIKAELKMDERILWEEIALLRKLYHPNVIVLHETFEDEVTVYSVLELCAGGELFDRVANEGGVPDVTAVRIMHQLASAVQYIHEAQVCHRDIQPESFLLKENGPLIDAQVKLVDFTTAKEFGPDIEMKTKICTVHFVAPEILTRKMVPYTEKVDVWSLGSLFFTLLCGVPPFQGEDNMATLKLVKKGAFKFEPEITWNAISNDAKQLLNQMLVVDPQQRVSASDVLGHNWLCQETQRALSKMHDNLVNTDQLNHLRNFHARSRVQKVMLRLQAQQLSPEAVEVLRTVFVDLDTQGLGEVHISEVRDKIRKVQILNDHLEEVMRVLWGLEHNNGKVKFDKLLGAMTKRFHALRKDAARAIFEVLDFDGGGTVSASELSRVLADGESNSSFSAGISLVFGMSIDTLVGSLSGGIGDSEYSFDEFMKVVGVPERQQQS